MNKTTTRILLAGVAAAVFFAAIPFAHALPCPPRNDFNADGRSDILWRKNNGDNYVFLMNGTSVLGGSNYTNSVPESGWQVVGTGDFDGDGNTDILWRKASSGENYIFLMNGVAVKPGSNYINSVAVPWTVAGTGDFDGDGKADILWRNTVSGEDYVFLMNGTSVKAGSNYINAVDTNWQIVGTGDFDGDGKSDILWRNAAGDNYVFLMNGTSVKASSGYTNTVGAPWAVAGVGDFDGDGKADILWRNSSLGENFIFFMNGTAELGSSGYTNSVAAPWTVVGTGDHDGDGKADILWRDTDHGDDYVFLMSGLTVLGGSGYTNSVPDLTWSTVPAPGLVGSSACGSVTPSFTASRTSGVAPLSVFFDATATTATGTSNPFQDVEYRWDFGDPAGGATWAYGARAGTASKNAAYGPVAAHVFETPGTYTVTLATYDGAHTGTATVEITVDDPDSVYAGNKTVCIRNSGGSFTSCPSGAAQVTTSSFGTALNSAAPGKRLLFEKGGTWSGGGGLAMNGPGTIGAYGSGNKPIVTGTLNLGNGNVPTILSDWRIMDLHFTGTGDAFYADGPTSKLTLLRVDVTSGSVLYNFAPEIIAGYYGLTTPHDLLTIADCTGGPATYGDNYPIFVAGNRLAFLGNYFHGSTNEHAFRIEYAWKFVVSNNTAADPAGQKHTFKLHALHNAGSQTAFTEYGVISDNKFSASNSGVNWVVSIETENDSSNENLRKLLIERNWIIGSPGGGMAALITSIQDSAIRNNVIDTSASNDATGIVVERRGIETAPNNVKIYNNTIYSSAGGSGFTGIQLDSTVTSSIVRNNIIYHSGGGTAVRAGSNTHDHNTGDVGSLTTNPDFTSTSPFNPSNAKLKPGSYGIGAGTSVPAWSDFFGASRPAARDLGAVNH